MPPPKFLDIRDLASAAAAFRSKLDKLKRENSSPDFGWYPYDTFSVFPVLERLLKDERRKLLSLADTGVLLDIGCGDGALSFFFESCGYRVVAVDRSGPNFNGTKGFATLATALDSSVEFVDQDVDAGLTLPGRTFGLALCLGILYHLKNPFGVLETLARHSRYCLLSTRIAQVTARGTAMQEEPLAYLLDPRETNQDASNYWIFSESGLRRILERTGWDVCDYVTTGCDRGSNPSAADRDQRAFCLLASKLPDPWLGCDLDGGWHAMEQGGWRWTERSFRVWLPAPTAPEAVLRLRFRSTRPVRLQAILGGESLPACEYDMPGDHVYEQRVSTAPFGDGGVPVRFELDQALRPPAPDLRELGVQVVFWSSDGPAPIALHPITLSQATGGE